MHDILHNCSYPRYIPRISNFYRFQMKVHWQDPPAGRHRDSDVPRPACSAWDCDSCDAGKRARAGSRASAGPPMRRPPGTCAAPMLGPGRPTMPGLQAPHAVNRRRGSGPFLRRSGRAPQACAPQEPTATDAFDVGLHVGVARVPVALAQATSALRRRKNSSEKHWSCLPY
jgi:hypothetical protein